MVLCEFRGFRVVMSEFRGVQGISQRSTVHRISAGSPSEGKPALERRGWSPHRNNSRIHDISSEIVKSGGICLTPHIKKIRVLQSGVWHEQASGSRCHARTPEKQNRVSLRDLVGYEMSEH